MMFTSDNDEDHDHFAVLPNNIAQIYVTARLKFADLSDGRSEVRYLSGVVPGPAESALSTHVLSRLYTALTERGEPLTEVSRVPR